VVNRRIRRVDPNQAKASQGSNFSYQQTNLVPWIIARYDFDSHSDSDSDSDSDFDSDSLQATVSFFFHYVVACTYICTCRYDVIELS